MSRPARTPKTITNDQALSSIKTAQLVALQSALNALGAAETGNRDDNAAAATTAQDARKAARALGDLHDIVQAGWLNPQEGRR